MKQSHEMSVADHGKVEIIKDYCKMHRGSIYEARPDLKPRRLRRHAGLIMSLWLRLLAIVG